MKYLVFFDGSRYAQDLLRYGLRRAARSGAEAIVLSVFHRELFVGYEGLNAEARARREFDAGLDGARETIRTLGGGLSVSLYSAEGSPEESVLGMAEAERVDAIFLPPRYRHFQKKTNIPVAIVPGTLLFPVDGSHDALTITAEVAMEALESGSRVIVLGVVPVHLYSRSEAAQLEAVQAATAEALEQAAKSLRACGIETDVVIRNGYPDDEILRAASEFAVSAIIFSGGGVTPSELRKAAYVLLSDREHIRFPLLFVPAADGA